MAKRGRPTEYTEDLPDKLRAYAKDCLSKQRIPWLEEFCHRNDISERTLRDWSKAHDEMRDSHDYLMMIQKMILKQLCISKGGAGPIFLLKANHGLIETDRIQHAGDEVEPLTLIFTDVETWRRHKDNLKLLEARNAATQTTVPAQQPEVQNAGGGYDWTNYSQNPLTSAVKI